MLNRYAFVFVILIAIGSAIGQDAGKKLDVLVPDLMKKADVPGVSIAVIRDGKTNLTRAYGVVNAQTGVAVADSTVFEAASLSKPVFAYAVLKLVDEGKIDLDAPISTYLPGTYDVGDDARLAKITARRVLSHTTGFPNWRQPRNSKTLPIHFEPGERFSYSGEGFVYLSKAMEAITKMPFDKYVKQAVLDPLGMTTSNFAWEERYQQLKTFNHDLVGTPLGQFGGRDANAAGSMHTTAGDYAKFIEAVMSGKGLSKKTHAEMLKVQSTTQADCRNCFNRPTGAKSEFVHWGLGVGLQKSGSDLSFWHWGDNGPAKAFFIASATRKDGIAIFANGTNGLLIIDEIVNTVLGMKSEAIAWIDPGSYDDPGRILLKAVLAQGAEKPLAEYRKRRAADPKAALPESRVNSMGYDLLRLKKVDEAIAVFRMNTEDFPKSGNVWDSLAEAYETKGDNVAAVANYKRSVELDPSNKNAAEKIIKLSSAEARSPSN